MKTIRIHWTLSFALSLLLVGGGCGGPSSTGAGGVAGGAKGPEIFSEGGTAKKLDRSVSKEAAKDFAEAVKYYKKQAKAGWNKDRCKDAASKFESVAGDHDKMVEARFNAGLSYQNCGMYEDAEEQYKKALKIKKDHAASLSNLGQIYFIGGNEKAAKEYWEASVKADAKIAGARANLAWLTIRQLRREKPTGKTFEKMHNEASLQLSRVLAVENENIEAFVLYALLYIEGADRNKSRLQLAGLLLEQAEKIDKNYAPLHNARGLVQLKREQVAPALTSFRRASQIDPNFKEAHRNVGNIVLDFRKYDEAASAFQKVLALDAKDYDAVIGLGIAHRGLGKLNEAEDAYNRAQKLDGNRPEAYFNLGVLYQDFRANATQNLREAQSHYKKAGNYFRTATKKPGATKAMKKEAEANIKVCDKNVKSLTEAIKFQESAPPS